MEQWATPRGRAATGLACPGCIIHRAAQLPSASAARSSVSADARRAALAWQAAWRLPGRLQRCSRSRSRSWNQNRGQSRSQSWNPEPESELGPEHGGGRLRTRLPCAGCGRPSVALSRACRCAVPASASPRTRTGGRRPRVRAAVPLRPRRVRLSPAQVEAVQSQPLPRGAAHPHPPAARDGRRVCQEVCSCGGLREGGGDGHARCTRRMHPTPTVVCMMPDSAAVRPLQPKLGPSRRRTAAARAASSSASSEEQQPGREGGSY